VMDDRTRRRGTNEAVFRQVNERIEGVNRAFATITDVLEVVCECGNENCVEKLTLTVQDYERVRSDPAAFVVVPGHESTDLESVVERGDAFNVTKKRSGAPRALAEQTDPRGD
jgi:hypothetical protein